MNLILSVLVSVLSFGAVGDGATDNTEAINRAIAHCALQGGGTVSVPQGVFVTGTVYLKSHVMLRLEAGATLKGTQQLDAYQPLRTTRNLSAFESGQGTVNYNSATDPEWSRAMILGIDVHHSGIEGEGCIDGNDVRNPKGEESMRGPHTVLLAGCSNLRFQDFKVVRSANYAFLAYLIDDTVFKNLHITGGWDGIHIRGSKRTRIQDCVMHTGDDAIAGGYWEKMTISHCTLNSSCNGIRMIMPSQHVLVSDCHIYGPGTEKHITSGKTSSDAAINLEPGAWGKAPGRIDDFVIRRVKAERVLTPLSVTLGDDNSAGKILVKDLVARGITRMALSVKTWGSAPTDKVVIRHADLQFTGIDDPQLPAWFKDKSFSQWPVFPSWGMFFRHVRQLVLDDVRISYTGKDYREPIILDQVTRHKGLNKVQIN